MAAAVSASTLRITDEQFGTALNKLRALVAIPSVSFPDTPYFSIATLQRAAAFVKTEFDALGFKTRLVEMKPGTAPYVIAEKVSHAALPTILLYAHYDVQPVDEKEWRTKPFELTQIGDRIYGRGASDDKAGIVAILTALRALQEAGQELPVNIKVLVEGDEEYGAMKIRDMVQQEKGSLAADCLVILDGGNRTVDHGTLETSTRGIVSLELTVNALNQPVHSGTGGLAPDPAQALAALITSLREPRRIRGFTDGCLALSPQERALLRESSTSEEEYRAENGVIKGATLRGSPNESVFERVVEEPSITIVNMTSGERNGSNSVQASARCKIGVRLTPGQDPDHVQRVIQQHFERQLIGCPFTLERVGLACKAWKGSLDGPYTQAYLAALRETYPKIALMPTGGALPLIPDFEEAFPKMETIIVGVEDPHTAAHSHNESQSLPVLRRAIDALIGFLGKAAKAASAKRDA